MIACSNTTTPPIESVKKAVTSAAKSRLIRTTECSARFVRSIKRPLSIMSLLRNALLTSDTAQNSLLLPIP